MALGRSASHHEVINKSINNKVGDPEKNGGGLLVPDDLRDGDGLAIVSGADILALQDMDPVLNMKMHLVNNVSPTNMTVTVSCELGS